MSSSAFRTSGANPITTQPAAATLIVVRQDLATEVTSLKVYGTISDAPEVETISANLTGYGLAEKISTSEFTAITRGAASGTPSGNIRCYSEGTAAIGDVAAISNPSDGDTLVVGIDDANFKRTYRFKTTMAAAYDVQIGASATDTMLALKRAINADGTSGTDYFARTVAHPIYSATVDTTVVTLTDRVPCLRQLAAVMTESAANFAKRIAMGGVDGTLLFSLSPTVATTENSITFASEDHLTDTLPGKLLATSVTVAVGGRIAAYRIYNELAIKVKFQTATDQVNWLDTEEGELTLGAGTTTFALFTLPTEFLRFIVTENTNSADSVVDARVIY